MTGTDDAPGRRPTIVDVARDAGVSKSQVSNALRSQGRISPETAARVRVSAQRLGYVANGMARSLREQRTSTLGVYIRDAAAPFYGELHVRMHEQAARRGYRLVATTGTNDAAQEKLALQTLLALRVEGLLICSGRVPPADLAYLMKQVPTVVAGRSAAGSAVSSVCCDDIDGGRQLADHLADLGHGHVAVLVVPKRLSATRHARGTAMLARLKKRGIRASPVELGEKADDLRRAIEVIMARPGVSAVMCPADLEAVGVVEMLRSRGRTIPGDMSVTGYDGVRPFDSPLLGLTTLRQPLSAIAHAAVDTLLDITEGRAGGHTKLRGELIAGGSTGSPTP